MSSTGEVKTPDSWSHDQRQHLFYLPMFIVPFVAATGGSGPGGPGGPSAPGGSGGTAWLLGMHPVTLGIIVGIVVVMVVLCRKRTIKVENGLLWIPGRPPIRLDEHAAVVLDEDAASLAVLLIPLEGEEPIWFSPAQHRLPTAAAYWMIRRLSDELPELVDGDEASAAFEAYPRPKEKPRPGRLFSLGSRTDDGGYRVRRRVASYIMLAFIGLLLWAFGPTSVLPFRYGFPIRYGLFSLMLPTIYLGLGFAALYYWRDDVHTVEGGRLSLARSEPIDLGRFDGFMHLPASAVGATGEGFVCLVREGEEPWVIQLALYPLDASGTAWLLERLANHLPRVPMRSMRGRILTDQVGPKLSLSDGSWIPWKAPMYAGLRVVRVTPRTKVAVDVILATTVDAIRIIRERAQRKRVVDE